MGKSKREYRDFEVWYSSGKGRLRVAKGRFASPEFWASVEAAKGHGADYCGHHNGPVDSSELHRKYQCRACARHRMDQKSFSDYRPPKHRQSLESIYGYPDVIHSPGGRQPMRPGESQRLFAAYMAEDQARSEARRVLADYAEYVAASPERSLEPPESGTPGTSFGLYDDETAANLAALRKKLTGD